MRSTVLPMTQNARNIEKVFLQFLMQLKFMWIWINNNGDQIRKKF